MSHREYTWRVPERFCRVRGFPPGGRDGTLLGEAESESLEWPDLTQDDLGQREFTMKLDLRLTILAVTAGVAIFNTGTSFGGWPSDPTVNDPLSRAIGNQGQNGLSGASDGMGGAIIAWTDVRTGDEDIFAQRLDGNGMVRWTLDGVAVCDVAGWQRLPRVVSDGAGGAIIVWTGAGGGVVAWPDSRNYGSTGIDIYVQGVFNGVIFVDEFESGDLSGWSGGW
jgi:hypothetical protein